MPITFAQQTPDATLPIPVGLEFNQAYNLMNAAGVVAANTVGAIRRYRSAPADPTPAQDQRYWVIHHVNITASPASPADTVMLYLVGSMNGTDWVKIAELPAGPLSTITEITELVPVTAKLPYIAAVAVVANNPTYDARVDLITNAPLDLVPNSAGVAIAAGDVALLAPAAASGTASPLNGQSGTIVIADLAVAGAVVFPTAFADALYRVAVTIDDTPSAVGLTTIGYDTKLATGFTVQLGAAPGLGNTYNINWIATA